MAIFTPGPTVAAVSGSIGGTVFSRNKGGAYIRNRAIPLTVTSEKALKYKSCLTVISQYWQSVTAANRKAWEIYAQQNTVVNALGQSKALTAANHFVRLNTRLTISGDTLILVPPVTGPPLGVTATSFVVDLKAGEGAELVFADTPLAAGMKLWIRGCKVSSAAINNVENLLTEILITAAAATSPVDLTASIVAAFGALQEGAVYVLECRVLDTTTGLVSNRVFIRTTAVDTTA